MTYRVPLERVDLEVLQLPEHPQNEGRRSNLVSANKKKQKKPAVNTPADISALRCVCTHFVSQALSQLPLKSCPRYWECVMPSPLPLTCARRTMVAMGMTCRTALLRTSIVLLTVM
jgi:hypothetical protein